MVACSLSLSPDRPIFLHDWQTNDMRLITEDSVRVVDNEWPVKTEKRLVYLADTGGDPKPRDQLIHAGFAVVTASPAASPKEFLKHSTSVRVLLPPWTREECEAVYRAIQAMERPPKNFPSHEEFERRFLFAGGIPRCLFGPQELSDRYEEGVNSAISNLDSTNRMDTNFDMREVVHKLLHIHPKDSPIGNKWDFTHLSYDFPTEDIGERVLTKIQELNRIGAQRSLTWFLGSGLKFSSMRALVGNYFETRAHDDILDSSSTHKIQRLSDNDQSTPMAPAAVTTTTVRFSPSKREFPSSFLESDLEEGVYYQPTSSNHPVADSWLVQTDEECGKTVVYLFQMTVQSSHPLKSQKLTPFVKHCLAKFSDNCIFQLIFVVPTQQSHHYQKVQRVTGSSPLLSKVEQWKMELYLPELNGNIFSP